jgi:ubiquinone/menaquinone biosynthesis C-methylase UbiE
MRIAGGGNAGIPAGESCSQRSTMKQGQTQISRVLRSKPQARTFYDRLSRWYDLLGGAAERQAREIGLAGLNVQPGERVVEIGPGTGHDLLALARATGDTGAVHGLDLSTRMLALARQRAQTDGFHQRITFTCGDGARLPFRDHAVDAIIMSFTLELFDTPEIAQVLCECRRVLRPGGRLCVVSLCKPERPNWITRLYEWGHERFPALLDCRPIFVRESVEEAGFDVTSVTRLSMWGLAVEVAFARYQTGA